MSIVTSGEVETLLQRSLNEDEHAALTLLIEMAQGQIETYLGRPVEIRAFTEVAIPEVDGAVYLKNTPVVTIVSVEENAIAWDETYYDLRSWGFESYSYGWVPPELTVEYTGGLDRPAAVRAVILDSLASRARVEGNDMVGLKRITVEDYSATFDESIKPSINGPITREGLASLDRLKRRTFG